MTVSDEDVRLLDRALQGLAPPADLERRIVQRIDGAAPARSRVAIGVAIAAAVGLAAGIAATLVLRPAPTVPAPPEVSAVQPDPDPDPSPDPEPASIEAVEDGIAFDDGCRYTRSGAALELADDCRVRLEDPAIELDVWSAAKLTVDAHGLALASGTVLFHVAPVADGDVPVHVDVAGGSIEVVGTRFVVAATSDGGRLDLLEGRVRFHADGEVVDVEAGRRHAWGSLAASAPTPPRRPPGSPEPSVDMVEALAEVARLRQQGEHAAAVRRLRALGRGVRDAHAREVLSFEEGTLLEKFEPKQVACAHWARHARRFGADSYAGEVARRRAALACE